MATEGRLGNYEIVELIGKGAMGNVYKAVDTKMFGREVALKVLPPDLGDDGQALERFMREIEVAAKLSHPNIITIHDWGQQDGRQYFVMEYINGFDLTRLIVDPDLRDLEHRVEIAIQVCDGLSFAHDHKVIHRDIKPANIMIAARGEKDHVKLVDFGIVHVDRSGLTLSGSQPGTMRYMSPEQLNASPIDHRSDLFSLGLVLYELFTGKHPHDGPSDPAVALEIMRQPAESACSLNAELPAALDALLLQLLEKDPAKRPGTAAEAAGRLREIHQQIIAMKSPTDPSVRVPREPSTASPTPPPAVPPEPRPADVAPVSEASPGPDPQTTPGGLIARANAALDSGNREEARAELVEAVRRFPDNESVRAMLGRLLEVPTNVDLGAYRGALREARLALDEGQFSEADRACTRAGEIWSNDTEWRQLQAEVARRSEGEVETALAKVDELRREAERLAGQPESETEAREAIKRAKRFVNVARAMGAVPSRCDGEMQTIDGIEQQLDRRIDERKQKAEADRRRRQELLRQGQSALRKARRLAAKGVAEADRTRETYRSAGDAFAALLELDADHAEARSGRDEADAGLRELVDRLKKAAEETEVELDRARSLVDEQRHDEALQLLHELESRCGAGEELARLLPEIRELRESAEGVLRNARLKRIGVAVAAVVILAVLVVGGMFGRSWWRGRTADRELADAQSIYRQAEELEHGGYEDLRQAVERAADGRTIVDRLVERDPQRVATTDLQRDYLSLLNRLGGKIDGIENEAKTKLDAAVERAQTMLQSEDPEQRAKVADVLDEAAETYRGLLGDAAYRRDAEAKLDGLRSRATTPVRADLPEPVEPPQEPTTTHTVPVPAPRVRDDSAIRAAQARLDRDLAPARKLLGSDDPDDLSRAIRIANDAGDSFRRSAGAESYRGEPEGSVDEVVRQANVRKQALEAVGQAIDEAGGLLASGDPKKLDQVAPVCDAATKAWRRLLGSDPPVGLQRKLDELKSRAANRPEPPGPPAPAAIDVAALRLDFDRLGREVSTDDRERLDRGITELETLVAKLGGTGDPAAVSLREKAQTTLDRSRAVDGILDMLQEWEAAWESADVDRVKAIWPTMPRTSELERLFRNHDVSVEVNDVKVDLDDDGAAGADVRFDWKTVLKAKGIDKTVETETGRRYHVERRADRWIIVDQLD